MAPPGRTRRGHGCSIPIDGTRSFIAGRPIFGTLIALMQDGWPMIGIIDQPVSGERWIGAVGLPTTLNGKPVTTRRCRDLDQAILATTGPQYFAGHKGEHFAMLAGQCRDTVWGGDCYNYALLASGHVDIVVEAGLKLHDIAALVPVVEGAGGRMCDWSGRAADRRQRRRRHRHRRSGAARRRHRGAGLPRPLEPGSPPPGSGESDAQAMLPAQGRAGEGKAADHQRPSLPARARQMEAAPPGCSRRRR